MTQPATPPSPRIVVVLGFHRSGTSMVTRMLNLLGVDLGDESELLAPEARDNARGYWEPRWMIELNEELLTMLGSSTFEPFGPPAGWETSAALDPLRERARTMLAERFADTPLWGWKDPRTSLTLPFWRTVVDEPMAFVVCVRSPADAVASALKRGLVEMHRWSYAERWLDYTGAALANTSQDERMLVFYEDALRDQAGETARLAAFLGIAKPTDEQLRQAADSVDPELRHHTTTPLDVALDPGLPVETRALYLLLRARRDLETAQLAAESGAPGSNATPPRDAAAARTGEALERIGPELRELHSAMRATDGERRAAEQTLELREQEHLATAERLRAAERQTASELELAREQVLEREDAVAERERTIVEREHTIAERERTIAERDGRIGDLERIVDELRQAMTERDRAIATYSNSLSWRVTRPLRRVAERIRQPRR